MSEIVLGHLESGQAVRVDIPTLVDSRALITGNSGAGKSRLMRRLAEQAHGKVQQIIVDPEGEFATLREKHDFLLAGKGGEVPTEPRSAALLARRLLELRASAILDLYDLKVHEQRAFVRRFLEALLELPRDQYRPVLVMIDEVHRFAPEKGHGEAESLDAVTSLMSQGRKRGLCGILASQRLSKLAKDAAAEAANGFVGRTTLDVDQKRAADVLGISSAAERVGLRDLGPGLFHAYGPAINHPGTVLFRGGEVHTTHPKAGQRHKLVAPAAPDAIRKLADEFADLPAQAAEEIRTLDAAKGRIRDLERQLRAQFKAPAPAAPKVVDKPILKDAQVKRLEAAVARGEATLQKTDTLWQAHGAVLWSAINEIKAALAAARETNASSREARAGGVGVTPVSPIVGVGRPAMQSRPAPVVPPSNGSGLTGPEQRILDALAWLESVGQTEPDQTPVAFLAGYTVGGGAFNNPRGALNTKGLIAYRGGRIALTDAGRALAHYPEEALTPDQIQRRVMDRLPGPERKILDALLRAYPDTVANDELARRSGYEPGGGAFNNPRGRLRSLGLIEYDRGIVKASPVLFLEGR